MTSENSAKTSLVRQISKNTIWLTISSVTSKLIGIVIVVLIARKLQAEGFGQYSYALSFGLIINVVADFGLSMLTNRDLARDRSLLKIYLENIIGIKIFLALVTLGLVAIIQKFIDKPQVVEILVYLATIYVILESFNIFFRAVFRAYERMHFETISRFIERGLILLLIIIFLILKLGIISIFIAYITGEAISGLITLRIIHRKFEKFKISFNFSVWKKILKPSLFFALTSLFEMIYFKIDAVMLSFMKNDRVTGLYSSAYDLLYAFIFIPTIMSMALFPLVSHLAKNLKEKFKEKISILLKYFLIVAFPLGAALYFSAPFLIKLVYGKDFVEAIPIFQLLTIALFFVFINFLNSSFLNALDKQYILTIFSGICMVVNVVLNLFLIPKMAAQGATIATIITEALLVIFSFLAIKKYTQEPKLNFWGIFIKLVISISIAIAITNMLNNWPVLIQSIIAVLVFIIMIFILKIFDQKDKGYILELLGKNKNN